MLSHVLEQAAILAVAVALLGVPGAALVSLLCVRAALPDALAVPAGALFGSLVACVATALQLATSSDVTIAIGAHIVLSLLLVVAAVVVRRRGGGRGGEASNPATTRSSGGTTLPAGGRAPVGRGWSWSTAALVVVGALFAWVIRGTVSLDGLYHVALTRKLVELDAPTFDNVNRFADGGPNPVYALPGWHAFVGWTSVLTGSDPIVAWEIMPVLVVALGALAAGGLARVLLATPRAEAVGVLAWLLARVLFARREVDGDAILFGAVPGQVTFELALPVVLAGIAVALTSVESRARRAALAVTFAGIIAIVVYHANYLPYVAIIGLGHAGWWLVASRRSMARLHSGRRLLAVGGWVAAMSATCFAVLVPLLASLENFGNAPEGDRIDYHLTETLGMAHVRGGHAFEMLGLPGLIALLAMPFLAWRYRGRVAPFAIVSGGLFALLSFSFLPPLFQLLRATGSLTLLLRINHAIGVLLIVAFAALVLEIADAVASRGWSHRRRQAWGAALVAVLMSVGVVLGYDRFMTDWPGYVAWVGLLAVVVVSAFSRGKGYDVHVSGAIDADVVRDMVGRLDSTEPTLACRGLIASVAFVLALGLALPVGAISVRRGLENMDDFRADDGGLAQGDLRCLGGPVLKALQEVPAGSVVLSDPVASFRAMAVAPVYVVGDYKVWNAATTDNRAEERLASINRFFDSSLSDEKRLELLRKQRVDYVLLDMQDGRWLDFKRTRASASLRDAWSALDRFADVQAYDGGGIVRLIRRTSTVGNDPVVFDLVAHDDRADEAAVPEANVDLDAPCNSYGLWEIGEVREIDVEGEVKAEMSLRDETIEVAPGSVVRHRIGVVID